MYGKPSIVIVEQHSLVAEAVKKLLELELGLRVRDTFSDASLLVAAFDKVQPDLILLHMYKPCAAEFELATYLRETEVRNSFCLRRCCVLGSHSIRSSGSLRNG